MKERQFVEGLMEGQHVNECYLVAHKDLRTQQNGSWFVGVALRDRTGEIGGVLWNNAVETARLFEVKSVVRVTGQVKTYRGKLQITISTLTPAEEGEYDMEHLVQSAEGGRENAKKLRDILDTVENPWIKRLLDAFWNEPGFEEKFCRAAAAKKWHHEFPGGLARHCYEMARIALTLCELFPEIDRDVLLAGVFIHDIGKFQEMSQDLVVDYTDEGKLLGHLQIGCDMVQRKMAAIGEFPEKLRLQLLHCILSHHGEMQNGSPVTPRTIEAIALHHIDNLDAQTEAFSRIIRETRGRGQEWSEYLPLIDRIIWAK